MINGRKVITLCGSTRLKSDFERVNKELTLQGNVVISVGVYVHCDSDTITDEQKGMLDKIHLGKIDLADAIFVINKDGRIGESTSHEIDYAKSKGKEIIYMRKPN
mgnify:CR=1 FL=1